MVNWGRLITAMVTPFDESLNINYEQAIKLAKHLEKEGNSALVITGTTGEAPTLSSEEKIKLYKNIKINVKIPIIAGVGTNSTSDTIKNAKEAQEAGVDGLLLVAPYYNKPNQDSLYAHFKKIAQEVKLPIMLYNVPGRTGSNIDPETVEKLSKLENIVALKEASGDINQISEIIRRLGKEFLVYSGDDSMTLPCLSVGGYGVVSVSSHIVSSEMKEMIDAFLQGNIKTAMEIHLKVFPIFQSMFIDSNPIPVKAALNMLGKNVGGLRLPLKEANENIKEIIEDSLKLVKS